jgi:hypothetical protein
MAYSGSTAASSVANPPTRVEQGLLSLRNVNESTSVNDGGALWIYNSTNSSTNMLSTGFFTDGERLGMRVGDIMIARCSSGEGSTHQRLVLGVLHSSDLSSGFALSSAGTITSTYG